MKPGTMSFVKKVEPKDLAVVRISEKELAALYNDRDDQKARADALEASIAKLRTSKT